MMLLKSVKRINISSKRKKKKERKKTIFSGVSLRSFHCTETLKDVSQPSGCITKSPPPARVVITTLSASQSQTLSLYQIAQSFLHLLQRKPLLKLFQGSGLRIFRVTGVTRLSIPALLFLGKIFPELSCYKSTAFRDEILSDFGSIGSLLIAQLVKNLPALRESLVQFLGWEDLLEKGQVTHSNILGLASPVAQLVKNPPVMQETQVRFLIGKIPWRRESLPTPVFWPGEYRAHINLQSFCSSIDDTQ